MATISRPNSWVSQDAAVTTQFTYALQLNPAPLTVSISGSDPVLGSLQFVVTNPTASAISLNSVTFTIQVGTDSSDLTTSIATVGTSVNDTTNWQIQPPGKVTSGSAVYTLAPMTGSSVSVAAGASIIVQIYNFPTVENPGNTTIGIKETAGAIGFTSFLVTTFPSGFYFNGLAANVQKGSQYIPVAQVANPATVTLTWNSSVVDLASFTIYYSNAVQGQQTATPSDTGLWTSGPLSADTVFTIVVTVSVAGGSPLTAALSTTVAIQNPDLIAHSLKTQDLVNVGGQLQVTGYLTASAGIKSTGLISGPGMAPRGAVIMYYGDIHDIAHFSPDGKGVVGTDFEDWQVCNGNNGSPDLRNRFVPGAGGSYIVGQQGGADAITLSNAQMPAHSHGGATGVSAPYLNYSGVAFNSQGVSNGIMINRGTDDPNGNRPNLITTVGWSQIQVQNHVHAIGNDGGGQSHENRPQFFALAYLFKLA
jgi:microcystin-dependent protein